MTPTSLLLAALASGGASISPEPAATSTPSPAPPARALDADDAYELMANQFLAEFGYADAASFDLDSFLADHFVHADLGLFRVHVPTRSMSDRGHARDFEEVAVGLVDLQAAWIRWATAGQGEDDAVEAILEDAEAVRDWVESWSKGDLEGAPAGDLVASLEASDETAAAAGRLRDYMARGASVGLAREGHGFEPIVLVPERGSYVRSVALAGLVGGDIQRSSCWIPNIVNFTEFYWGRETLFLPFEYSVVGATLDDYEQGTSMNAKSRTGLRQQVGQIAANVLLDDHFGENLPGSLAGGIALNLLIELYGECNTRVDGDPTARQTDPHEYFIPGGASEGGRLPPNTADSRWRERGAKDHFKKVLEKAQKEGGRDAERGAPRNASFRLQNYERTKEMVLTGPFLGSAANPASITVPEEFYGDQLEFLRAYRSAFLHFLRVEAMRREKEAAAAFAGMLRAIAALEDPEGIEKAVADAYNAPALSTSDLDGDALEARFLKWLSR